MKENSLLRNTIALYVRMFFSVCVNIYISRVILDVLGVDDYGIYSIVGGVVALISFINSTMSGSTSRFLSVAIGGGDKEKLTSVYNAAKHLHGLIAILILIIGETIGVWMINNYLSIPSDKTAVANLVYQLSLFTMLFSILHVPYTAMIISMERMDVYSKIEIVNILMKLGVVLILPYFAKDRLFFYGLLLLIEGIVIYYIYKLYCKTNYKEHKYSWNIEFNNIRPMLLFSGWDLLGWGGVTFSTQGRQIFINKFFGVALNAANGMASTASIALTTFTNNVVMAFRPRIIKYYANGNYYKMQQLVEVALLLVMMMMAIIMVPMFYGLSFLLNIWLVKVPIFTLEFCRLLLILNFVEVINTVIKIGIHASGIMKKFTIIGFIVHIANLLMTYLLFLFGVSVLSTYVVAILLSCLLVIMNIIILKEVIPEIKLKRICFKILLGLSMVLIASALCYPFFILWGEGSLYTLFGSLVVTLFVAVIFGLITFKNEINEIMRKIGLRRYAKNKNFIF